MNSIEKVNEFLAQAGTFYLTTTDGEKPKCRPIGFHMVNGDNVEICAAVGKEFLRYYGKAVFESDYFIAEKVLANAPGLQKVYNEQTGYKLGIFHLENATAEFRTMSGIRESAQFD